MASTVSVIEEEVSVKVRRKTAARSNTNIDDTTALSERSSTSLASVMEDDEVEKGPRKTGARSITKVIDETPALRETHCRSTRSNRSSTLATFVSGDGEDESRNTAKAPRKNARNKTSVATAATENDFVEPEKRKNARTKTVVATAASKNEIVEKRKNVRTKRAVAPKAAFNDEVEPEKVDQPKEVTTAAVAAAVKEKRTTRTRSNVSASSEVFGNNQEKVGAERSKVGARKKVAKPTKASSELDETVREEVDPIVSLKMVRLQDSSFSLK